MAMGNVVTIAAYRQTYWLKLIGLVQRSAAIWHSWCIQSNEPGELSQWHCHDNSTTNIGIGIIFILLSCSFMCLTSRSHTLWPWPQKYFWALASCLAGFVNMPGIIVYKAFGLVRLCQMG